jgi:hypothetical protein
MTNANCYNENIRSAALKKSILHVGADKCGSSSIQSFLSQQPMLKDEAGQCIQYLCLHRNELIGPKAIKEKLRCSISGYIASRGLADLRKMDIKARRKVRKHVRNCEHSLIFSCEGWLRSLANEDNASFLYNLVCPPRSERTLDIIAFVRPPVKWINSAWWQWGAWSRRTNFDDWLEGAIRRACWANYLKNYPKHSSMSNILVEPMRGDVVRQLHSTLNLSNAIKFPPRSNVSLPTEALCLLLNHRHHRPNSRMSKTDFVLMKALGDNLSRYTKSPWVLQPTHVERIISGTRECNIELLDMMPDGHRAEIQNDPSWWDPSSYVNHHPVDPFSLPDPPAAQLLLMASDLLDLLSKSIHTLKSNDMLDTMLHSSSVQGD